MRLEIKFVLRKKYRNIILIVYFNALLDIVAHTHTHDNNNKNVLYIIRETRVSTIKAIKRNIQYNLTRNTCVLSNNNNNNKK